MVLQTLEFSECLIDSPFFREKLHAHEKELDQTSKAIKNLIKECQDLLNAASQLSKAQRSFSKLLTDFQFECIGCEKTDDEIAIENSMKEFGNILSVIEDARSRMLERAYNAVLAPLEKFRKETIGEVKKGKQTFEKQTLKFYQFYEKYLGLKLSKQSDVQLLEADTQLDLEKQNFYRESMQYVLRLQEVQERKKFEFVELLLQFMYTWLTFYHEGYECTNDNIFFMDDLSSRLHKCRENFETTREEAEMLMRRMLEVRGPKAPDLNSSEKKFAREGYLFLLEKKALTHTWTKYFCLYDKQQKALDMYLYNQLNNNRLQTPEKITLTSCTRRAMDSIDKRFCFDVTVLERQQSITFQANSEEDRKLWIDAMDGKEPIYAEPSGVHQYGSLLDDIGFSFIKKCIQAIEIRGLEEEGLYRIVGVSSKVQKLTNILLDRKKADKINLLNENDPDCEMKTITSALKNYFRSLPEPLMTFKLHQSFIKATKQESKTLRINDIHELVHKLPESNFEMLDILMAHLKRVSECSKKNLMSISNIGVCFGPTLMRPAEETMAAIMDIKFCNLVVEILIENYEKIFKTRPEFADISNSRVFDSRPPSVSPNAAPKNANSNSPSSMLTSSTSFSKPASSSTQQVYQTVIGKGLSASPSQIPSRPPIPNNSPVISRNSTSTAFSTYSRTNKPNTASMFERQSFVSTSTESLGQKDLTSKMSNSQNTNLNITKPANKTSSWINSSPSMSYSQSDNSVGICVRTLYACVAENDSELSFEPNQIITNVRPSKEPGWLEGRLNGKSGMIPHNYVEYLKEMN